MTRPWRAVGDVLSCRRADRFPAAHDLALFVGEAWRDPRLDATGMGIMPVAVLRGAAGAPSGESLMIRHLSFPRKHGYTLVQRATNEAARALLTEGWE